jgi:hypothetical protein
VPFLSNPSWNWKKLVFPSPLKIQRKLVLWQISIGFWPESNFQLLNKNLTQTL